MQEKPLLRCKQFLHACKLIGRVKEEESWVLGGRDSQQRDHIDFQNFGF